MAGKKYRQAMEFLKEGMTYSVEEAVELLEQTNTVKFDPTVEIHFNLNLDPKHQDQMIRTTAKLPHGTGKTAKVCAFSDSISAADLKKAGAAVAWGEELIADIAAGNVALDFDVCVATPAMMRHLGKVARVLGPKGLMPNPKNVHSIFGKLSFGKDKLTENLNAFLQIIQDVKPSGAKGKYINSVVVCNAMGPGIKINMNSDEK